MRKRITYTVMGLAMGIILTGTVISVGRTNAINASDDRTVMAAGAIETTPAVNTASGTITNLLYTSGQPKPDEPASPIEQPIDHAEVEMLAKLIWGEARGVNSTTEKAAVAWCVLNRVDSKGYPNTIKGVITQPHQFVGYDEDYPATEEHKMLAEDVIRRWYAEKAGESNTGRVLPKEYIYFTGDGHRNYFTNEWRSETVWDWSLKSPYES